ncbi:MAG TPA: M14 family metallopeptidase [Salinimicrobium sp.]|nr:M14 family metallopeptidase [Salinimicrobium sp.]
MKKILIVFLLVFAFTSCDFSKYRLVKEYDFTTTFEKSDGKETATYPEIIKYYQDLDDAFATIKIMEIGKTDSGEPLHIVIFNPDLNFDLEQLGEDKTILFINNGIHPGESDGIDASMLFLRDLAQDSIKAPENTVLAVIPVYNIGGAINRNSTSRVNQNGPVEYGFRGNARNFDLNRDFIKADTRNTLSFTEVFHLIKPDVLLDTHVSNGADYQYTLTHLFTQHNKMGGKIGAYIQHKMMPSIVDSLANNGWPSTPYVNVFNEVPEKGFSQFMDYPRYSTGYASLWNTMGLMIETHMLKPYDERVAGTYQFMLTLLNYVDQNAREIKQVRAGAFRQFSDLENYPLHYKIDSTRTSTIPFLGYEAEIIKSEVTGLDRLKYNREKPFEKEVVYYNNFVPSTSVEIPTAYLIPQSWWKVTNLLAANNIVMQKLEKDSIMVAEAYYINDFETMSNAYEGHYLHFNTSVTKKNVRVKARRGDIIVPTDQKGIKYIMETLEPQATDSFFNWNFFDSVLQQKEHFSPYVYEDSALEFLNENPKIKAEFEQKKKEDSEFAKNSYEQLDWIFKSSPNYELQHMRYPIFRLW